MYFFLLFIYFFFQRYSLLYGVPQYQLDKLQRLQKAAPRLVVRQGKFCYLTPVLHQQHWLPVSFRINSKILLLKRLTKVLRLGSSSARRAFYPRDIYFFVVCFFLMQRSKKKNRAARNLFFRSLFSSRLQGK